VPAQSFARSNPGITYGTQGSSSPYTSRITASPSGWLVNAISASAWLCSTAGYGSSACSNDSTLGSGADASNRAVRSSFIIRESDSLSRLSNRRRESSRSAVKPAGSIVARSQPLPLT
jgi:hypothetical protein